MSVEYILSMLISLVLFYVFLRLSHLIFIIVISVIEFIIHKIFGNKWNDRPIEHRGMEK